MKSSLTNTGAGKTAYPLWRGFICLALVFALSCFAIVAQRALGVNPAPDGGYGNGNTAEGTDALLTLTTGSNNTAIGAFALGINTTGTDNTATGSGALINNRTGSDNTATGSLALYNNTASDNTATGFNALNSNQTGADNTATGSGALQSNTIGNDNTATGFEVLLNNTSGTANTASGLHAMQFNTTGSDNTASGLIALQSNTTGAENTALGAFALATNTTGKNNTAEGSGALANSTTGSNNVAVGFDAGLNLKAGSNNIDIGANVVGQAGEANTIRIGKSGTQQKTFVAGIFGKTVVSGAGVIVNSSGQLGTVQSSARFKQDIKPMEKASEVILHLKPVTFRYKEELDPDKIPQFGLIAEEVEKVEPDLVVRHENGEVTTVRYEAVNAMLLNEFLKEHRRAAEERCKIEEQGRTIQELEGLVTKQQKQIEKLTTGLKRVSDEVELVKPVPKVVANN
jgi:uncharacterized coiled-coil protein SlyX